MTPHRFGQHMDVIHKLGLRSIPLSRLFRIINGQEHMDRPFVVITFDDCTADNWIYAVPELLRRKMVGVFFAITDFLVPGEIRPRADQTRSTDPGQPFPEIMRDAIAGNCQGFMTQAEVRTLVHDLGMEVYSHSAAHQACFTTRNVCGVLGDNRHWSHEALSGQSDPTTPVHAVGSAYAHPGFGLDWHGHPLNLMPEHNRLQFCLNDFSRSKHMLETLLEQQCPYLCLPWGHYDKVTLDAARQAGYAGALTLDRTPVGLGTDPMRVGRLAVKDGKSHWWLAIKTMLMTTTATTAWIKAQTGRTA